MRFQQPFQFRQDQQVLVSGSQSLDLVTALTEATFSRDKARAMETAGERVNSLRILLRLAKDIRLLSFDSYTHATGLLDEIGRMIGGWRKSQ